jgi:asparagine synthase (glutamine-hydrolysing)
MLTCLQAIARRTAEWLGVKMHHVEMTEETFAANIEDAVWHNEVAVKDLGTVGKYMLSRLTRDAGIKVVLTGEGSDEHFGGYRELLKDFVREPDPSWPITTLTDSDRQRTIEELATASSSHPDEPSTAAAVRCQVNNTSFLGFTQYFALDADLLSPWTYTEFGTSDKRLTAVNALDGRTRDLMTLNWHPLHTSLYIWTKCALAKGLLTVLGDRCEMAHSVEGRQPFLDHRLTEYAMSLPPSMKIRYDPITQTFSEKWILKEAVKPYITQELYERKKHPFSAPVKYQEGGKVYELFDGLITKSNIDQLGWLEWEKCEGLVRHAIKEGDRSAFGQMILVGQFVILGKKFKVKRAEPDFTTVGQNGHAG